MKVCSLFAIAFLFTISARAEHDVSPGHSKPRHDTSAAGFGKPLRPIPPAEPKPAPKSEPAMAKPLASVSPGEDKDKTAAPEKAKISEKAQPKTEFEGTWAGPCTEDKFSGLTPAWYRVVYVFAADVVTMRYLAFADDKCQGKNIEKTEQAYRFTLQPLDNPQYPKKLRYTSLDGELEGILRCRLLNDELVLPGEPELRLRRQ